MGCDIHIVLESRKPGSSEWIGHWCTDNLPTRRRPRIADRDYAFFQRFAVRGTSESGKVIYPRNLPEDLSRLAWSLYMLRPTDHHSASHCTPMEFAEAWLEENPNQDEIRAEFAFWDMFGIDEEWPPETEYRLVFWFDN
ncbi:MAG: hypothetical protein AAGI03_14980 [Pseudomonadota bacterium]